MLSTGQILTMALVMPIGPDDHTGLVSVLNKIIDFGCDPTSLVHLPLILSTGRSIDDGVINVAVVSD